MSYNMYDNSKYKLIEELLNAIEETFNTTSNLDRELRNMKTF